MTEAQAKSIARLLCAVVDYFKVSTPANRTAIEQALLSIELPE